MNILYIVILTVLVVTVLSFLMPWISKTIEEPFVGSQQQCQNPATSTPVIAGGPATATTSWRDYVELGKQKYNFLGLLQSDPDNRAFTTPSDVGSLDTTLPVDPTKPTGLQRLNQSIQDALETVFLEPANPDYRHPAEVDISYTDGKTNIALTNADEAITENALDYPYSKVGVSYVEERVPPALDGRDTAAKCEVITMYSTRKTAPTGSGPASYYETRTGVNVNREQLCEALNSDTQTELTNAFPNDTTKHCGVCIKDAIPLNAATVYNPPGTAYNGIGGLFVSQQDINRAKANNNPLQPTYGTCAPGYFFVKGEQEKCKKAAYRLACEELNSSNEESKDGIALADSKCFQCITGDTTTLVYKQPQTSQRIRVRVVVPTGTGRTILHVSTKAKDATTFGTQQIFTLRSSRTTTTVSDAATPTSIINGNAMFFTLDANPDDTLSIKAYQEFPHRPRGIAEAFYVGFTETGKGTTIDDARELADSLECTLATVQQLNEAQRKGAQTCQPGWAADGKLYIIRSEDVGIQNPFVSASCPVQPTAKGLQVYMPSDSDTTPRGVWCYGIKPAANFLQEAQSDQGLVLTKPIVADHYAYYTLEQEGGISSARKTPIYSSVSGDMEGRPNYRGICIQLEQNSTNVNVYEPKNVPVEPFLTKLGETDITSITTPADRLKYYSRNGRFNDSQRLLHPKPADATPFSLMAPNQYWLWSPHEGTTQSAVFSTELKIPGYFTVPEYPEDDPKCATSILYANATYANKVRVSECVGDPREGDTPCLSALFRQVGGNLDNGTLSPTKSETNRKQLVYKDYDADYPLKTLREPRTQEEILQYLQILRDIAKGTYPSLLRLSRSEKVALMNDASQKLMGRDAIGPCERVVEVNGTLTAELITSATDLDEKCLDFLYKNAAGDSASLYASIQQGTYRDMGAAYSGLNTSEYTTATANEIANFPYKACQPTGSWAPIKRGEADPTAIAEIKSAITGYTPDDLNLIQKAISIFNTTYKDANGANVNPIEQAKALERCYGVKKQVVITSCNGIPANTVTFLDSTGATVGFSASDLEFKNAQASTIIPIGSNSVFTLPENSYVLTIARTSTTLTPSPSYPLAVLLKDADGNVVTMRFLMNEAAFPVTFLQEDIRPYMAFSDIVQGRNIRIESALGKRWFLQADGTLAQVSLADSMTYSTSVGTVGSTAFTLETEQTANVTNGVSIKTLSGNKYLTKSSVGLGVSAESIGNNANTDWVILPAINGAFAYVSIQLVNLPGYYLVAKRQTGGTYRAEVQLLDPEAEATTKGLDYALACWRILPADV